MWCKGARNRFSQYQTTVKVEESNVTEEQVANEPNYQKEQKSNNVLWTIYRYVSILSTTTSYYEESTNEKHLYFEGNEVYSFPCENGSEFFTISYRFISSNERSKKVCIMSVM